MRVDLNPEQERFVREQVRMGRYPSHDDVIREALNTLRDLPPWTKDELRRELQLGVDQLDRGERAEFTAETIIAEERRRRTASRGRA